MENTQRFSKETPKESGARGSFLKANWVNLTIAVLLALCFIKLGELNRNITTIRSYTYGIELNTSK